MDRDENSAVNIRDRYFIRLAAIQNWYIARLRATTSMEKASMEKHGVLCDGNDDVDIAVMSHFPIIQQLRLWEEKSIRFHTF